MKALRKLRVRSESLPASQESPNNSGTDGQKRSSSLHPFSIRLSSETVRKLNTEAAARGESPRDYARKLLSDGISQTAERERERLSHKLQAGLRDEYSRLTAAINDALTKNSASLKQDADAQRESLQQAFRSFSDRLSSTFDDQLHTAVHAAIREAKEESGLKDYCLKLLGTVALTALVALFTTSLLFGVSPLNVWDISRQFKAGEELQKIWAAMSDNNRKLILDMYQQNLRRER